MGNAEALHGRLTPALILGALLALAVIVTLGLTAPPASATSSFTLCGSCHDYSVGDAFHTKSAHANQTCTKCHVNGMNAAGLVSSACASCHGSAATISADTSTTHPASSCGSCHAAPSPTPTATATASPTPTATATATPTPAPTATVATTTLTAKAAPTKVKLRKKVKVSGLAGPVASLAGAKIAFKVERKVGKKWVKMKAPAAATVKASGAYSWSYKAVKKGSHRVTLRIKATTTFTAKKMVKTFRVK